MFSVQLLAVQSLLVKDSRPRAIMICELKKTKSLYQLNSREESLPLCILNSLQDGNVELEKGDALR